MRFTITTDADLGFLMEEEYRAGERAVTAAMAGARDALKADWRGQITGAGLGTRLGNAVRGVAYPRGQPSMNAAALIWSNAPKITAAHEAGPLIRSAHGFYLAIPTRVARRGQGSRGRSLTPAEWERRNNRRLQFVYRRGAHSLLVDVGNAPIKDRLMRKNGVHYAARKSKPRYEVIFTLVRQVKLAKRLNLMAAADRVGASLPGRIIALWKD